MNPTNRSLPPDAEPPGERREGLADRKKNPPAGSALLCGHRYGAVISYHSGADSYDGARGFRGSPRV